MLTSQAQPHLDPRPCSQLMWLLQPLGPPRSPSRGPSPRIFLVGVSVEPQKGRKRHLCPLMAAHLPHLVLTPCCCFLQAPLEMLRPGPEGRGLPRRPWLSFCSAAGPDAESQAWRCGLRPSAQLAWGLDPPLDRLGSRVRAASKAGGTWTGPLGLSLILILVPSSAWECLQPVLRPTPPRLNKQPRLSEMPVVSPLGLPFLEAGWAPGQVARSLGSTGPAPRSPQRPALSFVSAPLPQHRGIGASLSTSWASARS